VYRVPPRLPGSRQHPDSAGRRSRHRRLLKFCLPAAWSQPGLYDPIWCAAPFSVPE
jgi:hypothetical protein